MFSTILIFALVIIVITIFVLIILCSNSKNNKNTKINNIEDEINKQKIRSMELDNNDVEYRTLNCPKCNASLPIDVDKCPYCGTHLIQVKRRK